MTWRQVIVTVEESDHEEDDNPYAEVVNALEDVRDNGYHVEWESRELTESSKDGGKA